MKSHIVLLIALLSPQYKGDNDNVLGIRTALEHHYKAENKNAQIESIELNIEKTASNQINAELLKQEFKKYIKQGQIILIGAGLDGAEGLSILKSEKNNSKFIWSGHQLTDQVMQNLEILDIVVLPSYALAEEQLNQIIKTDAKLIKTLGVPHNITEENCIEDYNNLIDKIPASPNGYVITCLAGDAPDAQNNIHFYTKEEAYKLGVQLAKIAKSKSMVLLVTNGPRTGKYDPETQAELSVHEKDSSLDKVSESFLKGVKSERIEPIFNNFVYGEKSVFNGYLGAALKNENSLVVIGGESSSQITQATNLLPGKVYIKANLAMSDIHKLHVKEVLNAGVKELKDETNLSPYDNTANISSNDADIVATEFLKYYPEVTLIGNE